MKLQLSENTLHSRLNALKFYFEQVLKKEKFFFDIPRSKKQIQLPKVLNEAEIGRLFKAIINLKHKAIVFTAYSAGLRVSEVVNLKLTHIDSKRMTILIEQSKGKKDRYVNLSPLLLDILRSYLKTQRPKPIHFLFEGQTAGEPYSTRSAQQIFIEAKKRAGIAKHISFHGLRHSFATHLLEKGVDIKYIKDILGHFDIKTTERYVHVARKALVNISSPLDDLHEKRIFVKMQLCNPQSKKRIKQVMKINELKILNNAVVAYIYVLCVTFCDTILTSKFLVHDNSQKVIQFLSLVGCTWF